jgi:CBS domain-containing protein
MHVPDLVSRTIGTSPLAVLHGRVVAVATRRRVVRAIALGDLDARHPDALSRS